MEQTYSVEDLRNKDRILDTAYKVAREGVCEYEECSIISVEFVGSFVTGEAIPSESDLDIAVTISFNMEKAEFDQDTTIYTLESSVYPSLQHKIKEEVQLDITKVDLLVTPV